MSAAEAVRDLVASKGGAAGATSAVLAKALGRNVANAVETEARRVLGLLNETDAGASSSHHTELTHCVYSGGSWSLTQHATIASALARAPGFVVLHTVGGAPAPSAWWNETLKLLEGRRLLVAAIPAVPRVFERPVAHAAHRSDVARLAILALYGGFYVDLDTIVVGACAEWRAIARSSAGVVIGTNVDLYGSLKLCNAGVIAARHSPAVLAWLVAYVDFDGDCWDCHSVRNAPKQVRDHFPSAFFLAPAHAFVGDVAGFDAVARLYAPGSATAERAAVGGYRVEGVCSQHLWSTVLRDHANATGDFDALDHAFEGGDSTLAVALLTDALGAAAVDALRDRRRAEAPEGGTRTPSRVATTTTTTTTTDHGGRCDPKDVALAPRNVSRPSSNAPGWAKLELDFAVVGLPKCGTTSLRLNLASSRSIAMVQKEYARLRHPGTTPQMVANGLPRRPPSRPEAPAVPHGRPGRGGRAIVGVEHPAYAYSPVALARLAMVPRLKVVVATREPLAMLDSFYNYRVAEWAAPDSWFHGDLSKHDAEFWGCLGPPPGIRFVADGGNWAGVSLDHARPRRVVADLRARYGANRVLEVKLADVDRDPEAAYRAIFDFLGLGTLDIPRKTLDVKRNARSSRGKIDGLDFVCADDAVLEAVVAKLGDTEDLDVAACRERARAG